MSDIIGVRVSFSSRSRELRLRLGSFGSLLGRFAGVGMTRGLRARELGGMGSMRNAGVGGSAKVSGEGFMRGMRLKWEMYRWSAVMGKLLKSIWT